MNENEGTETNREPAFAQGGFDGGIMPYVRQTKNTRHGGRDAARVLKYDQSKRRIAGFLLDALQTHPQWGKGLNRLQKGALIQCPVRVGLVVALPVTKAGGMPKGGKNAGDFDNYLKAFLDAAVSAGVLEDDSPAHVHGLCLVDGNQSGFVTIPHAKGTTPLVFWRIEESTPRTLLDSGISIQVRSERISTHQTRLRMQARRFKTR